MSGRTFVSKDISVSDKLAEYRSRRVPYELTRAGFRLTITQGVYPTSELSELFLDPMERGPFALGNGSHVLDYGTGSGFLALQAAQRGATVIATDISPDCISCAKLNAAKAGVDTRIEFRCGEDLITIGPHEKFDQIYAGMPWDNGHASDLLGRSMYDHDFSMRRALFDRATSLLKPGGAVFFSSYEGHDTKYPEIYDRENSEFDIVSERVIKGLRHMIIRMQPRSSTRLTRSAT